MRDVRAELTAHVGGRPTATQAVLIEQAAQLGLRIATLDRQFAETGAMTEHDCRTYLAWANSYSRLMGRLDLASAGGGSLGRRHTAAPQVPATHIPQPRRKSRVARSWRQQTPMACEGTFVPPDKMLTLGGRLHPLSQNSIRSENVYYRV
jgi:hypothetical protein